MGGIELALQRLFDKYFGSGIRHFGSFLTLIRTSFDLKEPGSGNTIHENISSYVDKFQKQEKGARILLKKVEDPERFGVAEFSNSSITRIVEKPKKPKTAFAVTGVYMYDSQVFNIVRTLKPSGRGELEITDVNNAYVRNGEMKFDILKGFWTDAGTFESLLRANNLAKRKVEKVR